jgi:hypothetical protein
MSEPKWRNISCLTGRGAILAASAKRLLVEDSHMWARVFSGLEARSSLLMLHTLNNGKRALLGGRRRDSSHLFCHL